MRPAAWIVACPRCYAEPGRPCRGHQEPNGVRRVVRAHPRRVALADLHRELAQIAEADARAIVAAEEVIDLATLRERSTAYGALAAICTARLLEDVRVAEQLRQRGLEGEHLRLTEMAQRLRRGDP